MKHRLQRRQYKTKGPNYIWHIDGYDKLKPFGFCIHRAICGYSRRILWLEIGPSNNNPKIITQYFLNYVRQIHSARRLRHGKHFKWNAQIVNETSVNEMNQ